MNSSAAFWVLVVSYLWKNMGYDIILWSAGLAAIPENLYEAAKVDGAGSLDCFFQDHTAQSDACFLYHHGALFSELF